MSVIEQPSRRCSYSLAGPVRNARVKAGKQGGITRRTGLQAVAAAAFAVARPGLGRADVREITIGAPNSLTGGLGEIGQRATWGLKIAVDQTNATGGIRALGGAKLKLVVADTSSEDPTQAASVTRRLIDQDGVIVLAGATASAMTLAALATKTELNPGKKQ